MFLSSLSARGEAAELPSSSDGSTPLWTPPEQPSAVRFSLLALEGWLCSGEPWDPTPPEPPPSEDDPNGTEVDTAEVSCDLLDRWELPRPVDPPALWRANVVLETAAAGDLLHTRLRRLCLSCKRTLELSCGSFAVDVGLDTRVKQPWSPLTLLPNGDDTLYFGELTVALEILFTHVDDAWTARLPRTHTYSGYGDWTDTLAGYPPDWDGMIDADCDGVPETALAPTPTSFRPAAGKGGGEPAACLFDTGGSGRLCWTSAPGLP